MSDTAPKGRNTTAQAGAPTQAWVRQTIHKIQALKGRNNSDYARFTMSRKYKIRDQEAVYFVTFTVIRWLDVFIRREYKDILIESLRYCQKNKGLALYAYCVMTSHVHLIIGSHYDTPVEGIIRDIKKFTSVQIIEAIKNNTRESRRNELMWFFEREGKMNCHNKQYQFWQQHSHPIALDTEEKLYQRMDYLHYNPVEAGVVLSPEYYLYSSAASYAGGKETLIDVILI